MFSESVNHPNGHDNSVLDQHQSKELGRYIANSRKKNLVLHSLLHKRCKFCVNSFTSNCRNCCLPICQEFKKVNTKKLIHNSAHNIHTSNRNIPKKFIRSGLYAGEALLDTPSIASSPRLSPSPSVRNLSGTRSGNSSSGESSSPVPTVVNDLPLDKMTLAEPMVSVEAQLGEISLDLPSAPSVGLVLFNNEEQSDVVFLVGKDNKNQWRFPAHSFILEEASSFFKAIVTAKEKCTKNDSREIRINWCEHDTFHVILKYIYTNEVTIKSISAAMTIFNAANSFCLLRLSKLCLTFLYNQCNDENVLEMMTFFHQYLKHFSDLPIDNKNEKTSSDSMNSDDLLETLNRLIIRCFAIVDYFAQKVISSEEFANLSSELVGNILWRDTLNISSELQVFAAINQWACQQCKKTCKELTDANKRLLLGELIYYTRYLTLSLDDFLKGPYTSEILNDDEKQVLLGKIKSNGEAQLPKHMQSFKMDVGRCYEDIYGDEDEEEEASSSTDSPTEDKVEIPKKATGQKTKSKKKKSKSKKILNGIGEVMLCVIKLLD